MHRKRITILFCISIFLIVLSLCSCKANDNSELSSENLSNDNYFCLSADELAEFRIDDVQSAGDYIKQIETTRGICDDNTKYQAIAETSVDGYTYYKFEQRYNDYPVYGKTINLCIGKDSFVSSISGNTSTVLPNEKKAELSYEKAENAIRKYYSADKELVIIPAQENLTYYEKENKYFLAYDFFVNNPQASEQLSEILIDAMNGDVLALFSKTLYSQEYSAKDINGKTQTVFLNENGGNTEFYDSVKNIRLFDLNGTDLKLKNAYDANNSIFVTYWSSSSDAFVKIDLSKPLVFPNNTTPDAKAISAFAYAEKAYDFYKELNKIGIYENNKPIYIFINDHFGGKSVNACSMNWIEGYREETCLSFGKDIDITLDVVGHEYTHAVEQSISYMTYENESGAIMEGYSDIFGELIEDYANNGQLDNDISWSNPFRNMASPKNSPDDKSFPEVYKGDYWKCGTDDEGGVHNNSTVISHAAYLMANGINNNETFKIDNTKLATLWYRTLYMLNRDCTFAQLAKSIYVTAQQMQQDGELTAEQRECVKNAFETVGINLPDQITVKKGALLRVVDTKGAPCKNYKVEIKELPLDKSAASPGIVENIEDESGYKLELEPGRYIITVSDNTGESKHSFSRTVTVLADTFRNEHDTDLFYVTIVTDFTSKEKEDKVLEATDEDINNFIDYFSNYAVLPLDIFSFDSSNSTTNDVIDLLYNGGQCYSFKNVPEAEETTIDPLKRNPDMTPGENLYFKISEKDLSFICESIFNTKYTHMEDLIVDVFETQIVKRYFHNGYYYFYCGADGDAGEYSLLLKNSTFTDGRYTFSFILNEETYDSVYKYNLEVTASLKEKGDRKFWSIYSWNRDRDPIEEQEEVGSVAEDLTVDQVKQKFIEANNFYFDWFCFGPETDSQIIDGYAAVKSDTIKSIDDLKKEASKYFTFWFYSPLIQSKYKMINGKLYLAVGSVVPEEPVPTKYDPIQITRMSENEYSIGITKYYLDDNFLGTDNHIDMLSYRLERNPEKNRTAEWEFDSFTPDINLYGDRVYNTNLFGDSESQNGTGSSYESVVDVFFKALDHQSFEETQSVTAQICLDRWANWYFEDLEEIRQMDNNELKETIDSFNEEYGANVTSRDGLLSVYKSYAQDEIDEDTNDETEYWMDYILYMLGVNFYEDDYSISSYEIVDAHHATSKELSELKDDIWRSTSRWWDNVDDYYSPDTFISDAYVLDISVVLSVNGKSKRGNFPNGGMLVIKENGTWKVFLGEVFTNWYTVDT